jgi:hypothetical protein
LEEIESVRRSLQQQLKAVERGGEMDEVDSEGSSVVGQDEDDEDDEEMEDAEEDEEEPFEGFND